MISAQKLAGAFKEEGTSFFTGEPLSTAQLCLDAYARAGANALCVHYTRGNWDWYSETIASLKLPLPLFLILSRENIVPSVIATNPNVGFVVYPNQIYRRMMQSLENGLSFENSVMVSTSELLSQAK